MKSEGIFFMFLGIEEKKLPNFLPLSPKNRLFQANFLPKRAEKGKKLPKKLPICARALEFFRCPFCFPNFEMTNEEKQKRRDEVEDVLSCFAVIVFMFAMYLAIIVFGPTPTLPKGNNPPPACPPSRMRDSLPLVGPQPHWWLL